MRLTRIIPHGGVCYVCDKSTMLAFADPVTKRCVGKCCREAFEFAGAMLNLSLRIAGLCHPDGEACE